MAILYTPVTVQTHLNSVGLCVTPNLSVLICYHNEGPLLTRCLESFRGQPIEEILLYDDASTLRCDPFIPENMPIRVIRGHENVGPAQGRNRLLAEARGAFVHFHDADDWVMPEWGDQILAALPGVDVVLSEVSSYRNETLVCRSVMGLSEIDLTDPVPFALSHFILVPSVTLNRSLAQKIGGYPSAVWQSEDYYFHLKMVLERPRIRVIQEPLAGIDLRVTSRSQKTAEVWSCTVEVLKQIALELDPKYHQLVSEKAHEAASILFRCGSYQKARETFSFARLFGHPNLKKRNPLYRVVSRVSPMLAESFGLWKRKLRR